MEPIQKDSKLLPYLPPEIISNIVSRMEVKAILKFRCVSKAWLSLISSSEFVKNQLIQASRRPTLLLTLYDTSIRYFTCPLSSVLGNTASFNPKILDFHLKDYNGEVRIVGTSNGLFCLKIDDEQLVLYNPSTRESKYLPRSPTKGKRLFTFAYGFGYDQETNDYKIVEVYDFYNEEAKLNTKIEIYSLRGENWTTIVYPYGIFCEPYGSCIEGVIYWVDIDSRKVLSLDLVTYKYSTLELPTLSEKSRLEESSGELGGCLAAFCSNIGIEVDGWVMKESSSWIKMASILFSKDSQMFHLSAPYMGIYHFREKSIQRNKIRFHTAFSSSLFVENLVGFNFDGDQFSC